MSKSIPAVQLLLMDGTVPIDRELLARYVGDGDRAALDELMRRYIDFVYSTARREMLGDSAAAEDVTQAVFALLAQKAGSVPATSVGGWLFRATRYTAANAKRMARRRSSHEKLAATQKPEIVMDSSSQSAEETRELLPVLNDAMARLNDADRQAVILRFLKNEPIPRIASAIGTTEAATRKRIDRAIEKLRSFFTSQGLACAPATVGTMFDSVAAEQAPSHLAASIQATAFSAPAGIASLTKGVFVMLWFNAKKLVIGAIGAGLISISAGVAGYEMIQSANAEVAATQPSASNQEDRRGFTIPIEAVIHSRNQPAGSNLETKVTDQFISLSNAKVVGLPDEPWARNRASKNAFEAALLQWMSRNQIDVMGNRSVSDDGKSYGGLLGLNLAAVRGVAEDWDKLDAASLRKNTDLANAKIAFPVELNPSVRDSEHNFQDMLPATWLFRTKNGRIGVLQITESVDKAPFGSKVRFKLVEQR